MFPFSKFTSTVLSQGEQKYPATVNKQETFEGGLFLEGLLSWNQSLVSQTKQAKNKAATTAEKIVILLKPTDTKKAICLFYSNSNSILVSLNIVFFWYHHRINFWLLVLAFPFYCWMKCGVCLFRCVCVIEGGLIKQEKRISAKLCRTNRLCFIADNESDNLWLYLMQCKIGRNNRHFWIDRCDRE